MADLSLASWPILDQGHGAGIWPTTVPHLTDPTASYRVQSGKDYVKDREMDTRVRSRSAWHSTLAESKILNAQEDERMLEEGIIAPDFTLESDGGGQVSLSDYRGRHVVLYFYPKDDTPGCTTEACNFRDDYSDLVAAGAVVLGVSPDSVKSHDKFKVKYELPFALLSDPDHEVAEKYGAWGEKKMYGKVYMGIIRSTFVIDPEGKIIKVFPKVKPANHSQEVLAVLAGEEA
jgi:peroxiredoxin Q/BCP